MQNQDCIEETGNLQIKQHTLFYRLWRPRDYRTISGIIHINHGMAEHSGRYDAFARLCTSKGLVAIAQDHPGHGQSLDGPNTLGHTHDINFWKLVIRGVNDIQDLCHQLYGDLPTILFGHSMGSFAVLNFLEQDFIRDKLQKNGLPISGVILSGSTQSPWYLNKSLQIVAGLETWRQGAQGKSKIIDKLTFQSFNRRFSPTRTSADWLSRDENAVDRYVQDPLCGTQSSNQTWHDFAKGLVHMFKRRNLKNLPKKIPYLLISGDHDPLSDGGGIHRLEQSLVSAGIKNITTKTFPHGRHELLNEINHAEVESYLFDWIERQFSAETHISGKSASQTA